MEEQKKNLGNDKNDSQDKKPDPNEDDAVKNGQKAIAIQKEIHDQSETDEKKDAEKWRNEG